jgi:tetratricopeptide (TPR) repeat protein
VAKGFGRAKLPDLATILQWHRAGQMAKAEAGYRKLIAADRGNGVIYTNLGVIYSQGQRWDEAIDQYQRALHQQPDYYEAHLNLGHTRRELGQWVEADQCYQQALALRPELVEVQVFRGMALLELGQPEAALACYQEVLAQKPKFPATYCQLGNLYQRQGNWQRAIEWYRRALELDPQGIDSYLQLASLYQSRDLFPEAIATYERVINIQPDHPQARGNLAVVWQCLGQFPEAATHYQQALAARPHYAEAQRNWGTLLLAMANFAGGWGAYEYRLRCSGSQLQHIPAQTPLWNRDWSFSGELVLLGEQGLGDAIQFARYARVLRQRGLRVSLQVYPKLCELLASLDPQIPVYPHGYAYPEGNRAYFPLMSLPGLLDTDLGSIPAATNYLSISKAKIDHWRAKLGPPRGLRVAIAWQGNPHTERGTLKGRSLSLAALAPLLELEGIEWVSLQKFAGSEQLDTCPQSDRFLAAQAEITANTDWCTSGAIVLNCDVVITSDSALAHLAGALGVPTWVILPRWPEWRWLLDRPDSPWYPSLRLFRQTERGDWSGAIGAVAQALVTLLSSRPAPPAVALFQQASQLQDQGDLATAEALYHQAIEQQPNFPEALTNLGNLCQGSDRPHQALDYYQTALQYQPHHPQIHCNVAIALQEIGQIDRAIGAYERAIQLRPDYAKARTNLAMVRLLTQDFAGGWPEYEQRFYWEQLRPIIPPQQLQRWDGNLAYRGEVILVAEQGFGDTMQFARYAKVLHHQGLRVAIQADPKLMSLLATLHPDIPIYGPEQRYQIDRCRWYPLMSLPALLKTTGDTIPAEQAYLSAEPQRVDYWRAKLRHTATCKVAIAWQGNPIAETGNIRGRSFQLEELAPLAEIAGVEWISLQKFHGSEQLAACSFRDRFVDCQEEIDASTDWADTAAIIASCHLVITSDTAIAHLAGALGAPTWLMLKKIPEWRWQLNRRDSPWYPTLRLIRQSQRGVWAGAFGEARHLLALAVQGQPLGSTPET